MGRAGFFGSRSTTVGHGQLSMRRFVRLEIENHENVDPRPSTNPILAAVRPAQPGVVYWFRPSDNPDDPVTLAFFGREVPGDPYHELQVQPTVTPGTK